jgi:hypothetical protein
MTSCATRYFPSGGYGIFQRYWERLRAEKVDFSWRNIHSAGAVPLYTFSKAAIAPNQRFNCRIEVSCFILGKSFLAVI